MNRDQPIRWTLLGLGALFSISGLLVVFFGNHHVDEGYYHLIGTLTARGRLPYRDYLYVQTPLYPFVYGALIRVFGSSLLMVRGYSLLLSLLNFLLVVRIARHLKNDAAAAVAATLIVCQPFTLYYLGIIKLYALAGLLLTAVVGCLVMPVRPAVRYPLAAATAALAVGTRLTLLPALPVIVVLAYFRTPVGIRRRTAVVTALAGALVFAAILIPFQTVSPGTFGYSVLGYHLDKEGFSPLRQILHKIDVVFRLSRLYGILIGIFATALWLSVADRYRRFRETSGTETSGIERSERDIRAGEGSGLVDSGWLLGAVAAFHLVSQEPYVHRYMAMLVPSLAAIGGPVLVRLTERFRKNDFPRRGILWFATVAMLYAGMGQWELKFSPPNPVAQLNAIAREIELLTGPGDEILTFNNSVAVAADRPVLPGDEMNVLTYDPAWTRERCEMFHVLNVDMLEEALLTGRLRAVLVTRYSFIGNFPTFYNPGEIGARPRILAALEKHYHKINTFPGFGYMGEPADLYVPVGRRTVPDGGKFESGAAVQIYRNEGATLSE